VEFCENGSCGSLVDRVAYAAENIGEPGRYQGLYNVAIAVVFKCGETHFSLMFRYETSW